MDAPITPAPTIATSNVFTPLFYSKPTEAARDATADDATADDVVRLTQQYLAAMRHLFDWLVIGHRAGEYRIFSTAAVVNFPAK